MKKEKKRNTENTPVSEKPIIKIEKFEILLYLAFAFIMTIIVECFCRRSIPEGLLFIFKSPIPFAVNFLIIFFTYLLASMIPKKIFSISMVTVLWLTLAIIDCVLMGFRVTPLSAIDFYIFVNVISILNVYLSVPEIVLYIALIIAAITALVFLCIKTPMFRIKWKTVLIAIPATVASFVLICVLGFNVNALSDRFPNLLNAYDSYGFPYCFSLSLFDHGIDKPSDYSKNEMEAIANIIGKETPPRHETPNIIYLQLESFFDVNLIDGVEFSEDPTPNFTRLKATSPHGLLTVPTIGAGTVNTEFEVLTGMDVQSFGAGEYPYKSILSTHTCESLAYILSELGYNSHAIHNHEGSFYSRNEVYANLGFDTFTSIEYMKNAKYNINGWAKDEILTDNIMNAMRSTDGKDFVFTVSVQGHGKYPTEKIDENQTITVTSGIEDEDLKNQFEYYINQINGTDRFLADLEEMINSFDEKTVIVAYGDHLPSLSISEEILKEGTLFTTEYIILSNYGLEKTGIETSELKSYELTPFVLKTLGISNGFLNRLWQKKANSEDYSELLNNLMYDMLYGDCYIFGGNNEYYPQTDLHLGIDDIKIINVYIQDKILYVEGENFTKYSNICINGMTLFSGTTVFIDSSHLKVSLPSAITPKHITIRQVSNTDVELSQTQEYIISVE